MLKIPSPVLEMERRFVVGDTEQWSDMVFSWTGVPMTIDDNELLKIGNPYTLINKEAVMIDNMNSNLEQKIKTTLFDSVKNGEKYKVCSTTREFLMEMGQYIHRYGGILVHHSLDRDINFLYKTDKQFGQTFFKHNPLTHKDICTTSKCWTNMIWICSQRLLDNRCRNYSALYRKNAHHDSKLLTHLRFTFGNDYEQKHLSADDAKDLAKLLAVVFVQDKFFIGRSDFIIASS